MPANTRKTRTAPSSEKKFFSFARARSNVLWILIATAVGLTLVVSNLKETDLLGVLSRGTTLVLSQQEHQETSPTINGRQQVPCQLVIIQQAQEQTTPADDGAKEDPSADLRRFRVSPLDSWTCTQEVPGQNEHAYELATVEFQIHECPPYYSASTFQLQASTAKSRMMGYVSNRYTLRDECGIYNATVPVMDLSNHNNITMELFWTSAFRHYSNHIKDIEDTNTIKTDELKPNETKAMFTKERLAYLQRHLDLLPDFPKHFSIQLESQQQQSANNSSGLPDCGTIPMSDWHPAGVFDGPVYDTSPFGPANEAPRWPLRPARCRFPSPTLAQYNELYAGLRIKTLGDSHNEMVGDEARSIVCPELAPLNHGQKFFEDNYDCVHRNNTFLHAHRFFRGVYGPDMINDHDALAKKLRMGSSQSCRDLLGLGWYNVTIITTPHWLFVYETQEGLDNYLVALESLFENCKRLHRDLWDKHVILLQSASARDSLPFVNWDPAASWRGIHNHRLERFAHETKKKLGHHVAGVIPLFEMVYARMWTTRTRDTIHLPWSSYRDIFHIQMAAVRSGIKFHRGLDLPLMKSTDPNVRWFAGLGLERRR